MDTWADLEAEAIAAIKARGLKRFRAYELRGHIPRTNDTIRRVLYRLEKRGFLTSESVSVSGYRASGGGPGSGLSIITHKKQKFYIVK